MLRFEEVSKRFDGGTVALEGVSFEVPRGQLCAVLGPSGAGKSTLLRLVNGMHMPSSGRVVVGDTPVTNKTAPRLRRRIGMVHQQFHLVPRLSVLDNVLAGTLPEVPTWRTLLKLWPRALIERAVSLLAQVELTERHLYQRASQLSGGEQQRVAIARAFILDPDVVLADEPVASLDPATSRSVLALLAETSRRTGATVLCSLHQIDLAVAFADRIVAIRRGGLAFDGPPGALDAVAIDRIYADARPQGQIHAGERPQGRSAQGGEADDRPQELHGQGGEADDRPQELHGQGGEADDRPQELHAQGGEAGARPQGQMDAAAELPAGRDVHGA
jgi:phosphonate transport system ATP-binding protein